MPMGDRAIEGVREIDEVCVCVGLQAILSGAETQRRWPLRVTITVLQYSTGDHGTCETDWSVGSQRSAVSGQRSEVTRTRTRTRPLCCFLHFRRQTPQPLNFNLDLQTPAHAPILIRPSINCQTSRVQGARCKDSVSRVPARKPRSFKKPMLPPGAAAYVWARWDGTPVWGMWDLHRPRSQSPIRYHADYNIAYLWRRGMLVIQEGKQARCKRQEVPGAAATAHT